MAVVMRPCLVTPDRPMVWTAADAGADPQAEAMAAELGRADRDAVILWLRHSLSDDRAELGARIMLASVFAQAGVLGVVSCTSCGDRGCDWCGGRWSV